MLIALFPERPAVLHGLGDVNVEVFDCRDGGALHTGTTLFDFTVNLLKHCHQHKLYHTQLTFVTEIYAFRVIKVNRLLHCVNIAQR